MADIEFDLFDGLCVNGVENKHVVMRGLTAGDIIAAEEGSEICYHTAQGPVVLSSPIKAMVIALSRVVQSIGDIKKVSQTELKMLTARDFDLLQNKYLELRGVENLAEMGRDSEPLQQNA